MSLKTKVYWAYYTPNNLSRVSGFPPERLVTSLKKEPLWRDTKHGDILRCPSTLKTLKNTYVIRSSLNAKYEAQGDLIVSDYASAIGHTEEYLQLHAVIGYYFFAEKPVTLNLTPPYYHPECMAGVSGSYDISKWLRPVGPTISMKMKDTATFKYGQPVMYVDFDKPVDLVQFYPTEELRQIADLSASLKTNIKNTPLSSLYKMFARNKLNKKVIHEICNNLL